MSAMLKRVLSLGTLLLAISLAAQTALPSDAPLANVTLKNVRFLDALDLPKPIEREIARMVVAHHYGPDYESILPEIVRDGFQHFGYFKATVSNPRYKVLTRTPALVVLEADVVVDPGARYRLGSIEFNNATTFSAAELRAQFPIADGDVFNIKKAREGIKGMKDLYGTKGYINFTPIPDFTFHDDNASLTLRVDIDEGAAYRVGDLIISGEESEPGAKEQLLKAWARYKGSYRSDAIELVLRDLNARPNLPIHEFVEVSQDQHEHVLTYRLTLGKPHRLDFAKH
jgi:hypothetical protein